ncbi:hypothetical protein Y038_2955 [Burkholderia pseudomallei MSHR543]|nr:hypothetical protein Y038_2955 [Burkholderia pseudomallei MSHR543]
MVAGVVLWVALAVIFPTVVVPAAQHALERTIKQHDAGASAPAPPAAARRDSPRRPAAARRSSLDERRRRRNRSGRTDAARRTVGVRTRDPNA